MLFVSFCPGCSTLGESEKSCCNRAHKTTQKVKSNRLSQKVSQNASFYFINQLMHGRLHLLCNKIHGLILTKLIDSKRQFLRGTKFMASNLGAPVCCQLVPFSPNMYIPIFKFSKFQFSNFQNSKFQFSKFKIHGLQFRCACLLPAPFSPNM